MFRKLLKFPKHGSRNNIKYGYKKTLLPFETASLKKNFKVRFLRYAQNSEYFGRLRKMSY